MDIWDIDKLIKYADNYRLKNPDSKTGKKLALDKFSLDAGLSKSHYRLIKTKERKSLEYNTIKKISKLIGENPIHFIHNNFLKDILNYILIEQRDVMKPNKSNKKGDAKDSLYLSKKLKET